MPAEKLPVSKDARYLKWSKRVINNTMDHQIITPTWCCGFNVLFFNLIVYASLGYVLYSEADGLNEYVVRYDEVCAPYRGLDVPCEVTFTPDVDLSDPKIYYRLDNFYQNHRSFQKYSFAQLRGEEEEDVKIDQCDPVMTNLEVLGDTKLWDLSAIAYPENLMTPEGLKQDAWPCGFIAKFTFSDSFSTIKSADRSFSVNIDDSSIAHTTDIEKKFILNEDMVTANRYWMPTDDQHVMVWYQMETLKDFDKLYGSIQGTMKAGKEYTITVFDRWASDKVGNEKSIVFAEIGTFGGKNFFLAYIFGGAACLTLLVILFFFIGYFACIMGQRTEEESYIRKLSY